MTTSHLPDALPDFAAPMPPNDLPHNAIPGDDAAEAGESGHLETAQGTLFDTQPMPWDLDAEQDVVVAGIVFSEQPYGPYHYRVPPQLVGLIQPGMRVRVPLGRGGRKLIGWCYEVTGNTHPPSALKDIVERIDEVPLCDGSLVKLVVWISRYYQAPPGQVFDALIPAGVRSAAGTRERTFLTPSADALDESVVTALPRKQQAVLRHLIAAARPLSAPELCELAGCTNDPVNRLRKKGLVTSKVRRVMQTSGTTFSEPGRTSAAESAPELTDDQKHALDGVIGALNSGQHQTLLLQGVTGSGKTEVYLRAIEHLRGFGRGSIVLVPEISLTPQTRRRFEDRFERVAVLHSQMSPAERHYQWQRISSGDVQVVIGPRSAIFAPVPHLGLIIIDEEHDGSFKQDVTPRYHARDVARRRAALLQIPLLLGSATPALESWHDAIRGGATLLRIPHRILERPMPDVQLLDLRLKESRSSGAISRPLHKAILQTLKEKGQVILLLNRRGFATSIQCPACGHVVACPECDMPLTHHRDGSKAQCHYCDYQIPTPPWCPECRFDGMKYSGLGTQRLEQEIKARFPDASVARMDSDTMRRPGSHERVLTAFRRGELDILLGTQMIAKGLDFPNVLLVGVINADSALHFPDFRASERTFQLVTQVAGRTGRGSRGGRVLVQTFTPEHPAIQAASRHDFDAFAAHELEQRRRYGYPPYGHVARIIVRGSTEAATEAFADSVADRLEEVRATLDAEVRILGPAPPPIAKLRGKYRFHILLQCPESAPLGTVIRKACKKLTPVGDIQFVVDIDPIDML